tara:strand:- start:600 stop:1277 length:678 start_codon:yes stop_codon:yes gene_type:complete
LYKTKIISLKELILSAKKINKSYQDNHVILNANLNIEYGDSICILGENGSGKSTLLKIFSGLLKPDHGTLKVLERDPYKQPENLFIKQRMGVLMHSNMLYPQLTLKENLLFFSKLLGIIEYKNRVSEVAEELSISRFLNIEIYKLSNGNQRKAGFAKSLLNNPEILIADEPDANIDNDTIEIFSNIFTQRSNKSKVNLFTSHNEFFLKKCSNRKINLKSGSLSEL